MKFAFISMGQYDAADRPGQESSQGCYISIL